MKQIYKYPVEIGKVTQIPVSDVHEILHFENLYVWILVDVDAPRTAFVSINVVGTGWDLPDDPGKYLGTTIMDGFVWHAFAV